MNISIVGNIPHLSMDWCKGKSTGNYGLSHEILRFPVTFHLNRSIQSSNTAQKALYRESNKGWMMLHVAWICFRAPNKNKTDSLNRFPSHGGFSMVNPYFP
jgi:hypothetical protein